MKILECIELVNDINEAKLGIRSLTYTSIFYQHENNANGILLDEHVMFIDSIDSASTREDAKREMLESLERQKERLEAVIEIVKGI